MATQRQIQANRANARKSTGPRTAMVGCPFLGAAAFPGGIPVFKPQPVFQPVPPWACGHCARSWTTRRATSICWPHTAPTPRVTATDPYRDLERVATHFVEHDTRKGPQPGDRGSLPGGARAFLLQSPARTGAAPASPRRAPRPPAAGRRNPRRDARRRSACACSAPSHPISPSPSQSAQNKTDNPKLALNRKTARVRPGGLRRSGREAREPGRLENRWRFENRNAGPKTGSRQGCPPHTKQDG